MFFLYFFFSKSNTLLYAPASANKIQTLPSVVSQWLYGSVCVSSSSSSSPYHHRDKPAQEDVHRVPILISALCNWAIVYALQTSHLCSKIDLGIKPATQQALTSAAEPEELTEPVELAKPVKREELERLAAQVELAKTTEPVKPAELPVNVGKKYDLAEQVELQELTILAVPVELGELKSKLKQQNWWNWQNRNDWQNQQKKRKNWQDQQNQLNQQNRQKRNN